MLERHLRIGDALTEDALVEKTMMEGGVSMVRGDPPLKFTKVVDPVNGTHFRILSSIAKVAMKNRTDP